MIEVRIVKVKNFGKDWFYFCYEDKYYNIKNYWSPNGSDYSVVKIPKNVEYLHSGYLVDGLIYMCSEDVPQEKKGEIENKKSELSNKRFEINGLISELGLKIRNSENLQEILNYELILNNIENILSGSVLQAAENVKPNNILAKEKNKEKRKEEFIKKFEEAKEKLNNDKPHWRKLGLNEILKEAGLNKQTFYNYKLNEIYKF